MNHFMARLIFCFFAEKTDIFIGSALFTATISQMGARDSSDTNGVIGEIFRAMNTAIKDRAAANLRPWAETAGLSTFRMFGTRRSHMPVRKLRKRKLRHRKIAASVSYLI